MRVRGLCGGMGKKSYYLCDVDEDLWSEWVNSFDREESIRSRLLMLIEEDAKDD